MFKGTKRRHPGSPARDTSSEVGKSFPTMLANSHIDLNITPLTGSSGAMQM
jgi:hypothetical protein